MNVILSILPLFVGKNAKIYHKEWANSIRGVAWL